MFIYVYRVLLYKHNSLVSGDFDLFLDLYSAISAVTMVNLLINWSLK